MKGQIVLPKKLNYFNFFVSWPAGHNFRLSEARRIRISTQNGLLQRRRRHHQCDQIGQILEFLDNKFYYNSSPNV